MASKSDDSVTPVTPAANKWPIKKDAYELKDVIGCGSTAVVQSAVCTVNNEKVAIKRIDLDKYTGSIEELQKEIQLMGWSHHNNVMTYYTSFVVKHELWLVMKLMTGGSLLDILKHMSTKDMKGGYLDETVIATVLKEVLQGLEYFHNNGQIHRDVKAGNILLGEDGTVQLADFGVSTWLYDRGPGEKVNKKAAPRSTFVGTPCWMAPEVMEQSVGYNTKADIWSIGITALELATGVAPYSKFPPLKVIMVTLENPPPTLETCGELNNDDYTKRYSKVFRKMVEKCLQKDPDKRPTTTELLKHQFFKKAKTKEFMVETLLSGAPSLTARAKKVKRVPGTSGLLHKTEDGAWVWSDDDLVEEDEPKQSKELTVLHSEKTTGTQMENVSISVPSSSATTAATSTVQSTTTTTAEPTSSQTDTLQQEERKVAERINKLSTEMAGLRSEKERYEAQGTKEDHDKAMTILGQLQDLERSFQENAFQQKQISQQLQQTTSKQSKPAEIKKRTSVHTLKLALRLRDGANQLKDIKFEFTNGVDKPDAIASELVGAKLIDANNLVVVAANIAKFLEANAEKLTFPLSTGRQPVEKGDEKKLIGYAQLSLISSTMGSTV